MSLPVLYNEHKAIGEFPRKYYILSSLVNGFVLETFLVLDQPWLSHANNFRILQSNEERGLSNFSMLQNNEAITIE